MLWTPKKGILRTQTNVGSVGSTGIGTAVTTHATLTTSKGTPVELIASTSFDTFLIYVTAMGYSASAANSACCVDILAGAATEEVIIPDLLAGQACVDASNANDLKSWMFPLYIPAGTRIAAQAAGARVNTAIRIGIWLFGGDGSPPFQLAGRIKTYGIGTLPNGTAITHGVSAAEGSWTQIAASTAEHAFGCYPSYQSNDASMTTACHSVDVGIGAAAEEQIGPPFQYQISGTEQICGPLFVPPPILHPIPSGTRLVMRASSNIATADGMQGAVHTLI